MDALQHPSSTNRSFLPTRLTVTTASAAVTAAAAASVAATAATAAAVTATASAAAAAESAAAFLRLGFVDLEFTAVDFLAVELSDSILALFLGGHFDESETARAARFTVLDHIGRFDRANLAEKFTKVLVRGVEGKISHVKFH